MAFFYINFLHTCTYFVYFKSKKELNYDRFVDPNILGAARLVHSDLRIYLISFFLLDLFLPGLKVCKTLCKTKKKHKNNTISKKCVLGMQISQPTSEFFLGFFFLT